MDKFSFSGRSPRMDFWLVSVGLTFVQSLVLILFAFLILPSLASSTLALSGHAVPVAAIAGLVINLAFLWPITAVAVRRSHDRNLSGWWYGTYVIVGIGLDLWRLSSPTSAIAVAGTNVNVAGALTLGSWAVGLVFLLVLGVLPGTPGHNRFGPSPHSRHRNYRAPLVDRPGEPPIADEPAPLR